MALNWTPAASENLPPRQPSGNPVTGAIVFGLLALGAGIWLTMQISQMNDLAAARATFDSAPSCTTTGSLACRQTALGKINDLFLYNNGHSCNFGKSCAYGDGDQPTCQLGVQVAGDVYEEYMASPQPCYSDYKGEIAKTVLYNGALVSIAGAPTRDNPDSAASESAMFLALAGFVALFGLTGAVFLGAKALTAS